ncbi:unnamed protein product [Blepharisma stoltei]|uniref:BRO1 domain-containing protein n=1 Tax=Blepharisma stoltei TaxID=1481888 RepID=A0AAU9JTK7_9CILI|nr:unnamed protein product [Blepharisma stoltei]
MLSIIPKRAESTKIYKNLEKYIRKHYDKATLERVGPFIMDAEQTRERFIQAGSPSGDQIPQYLQSLSVYYRYVKALENRLPLSSTNIKFTWLDSLSKRKMQDSNFLIEKIGILYNIGAAYSKQGADINLSSADGHKLALNYFQVAAGCFNEVRKLAVEVRQSATIDISPEHLTFATYILLAQAYFCMYDKLDKATANKLNLAKLSQTISKNYGQAYELAVSEALSRHIGEEMKNILKFQQLSFAAASKYWMSFIDREEGSKLGRGFGKGVSRLRVGFDLIQRAMQTKNIRGPYLESGRTLLHQLKTEKEHAEAENLSVYMDSIPEAKALQDPEELTMIAPKFPPMVDIVSPINGEQVLQALVPPAILALSAEYKELLHNMILEESDKVAAATRNTTQALESMNLPHKLDAITVDNGLPDSVWKKVQQVQSYGGFAHIENGINSLRQLSENSQKFIAELESMVIREDEEDRSLRQMYGSQWGRAHSAAVNTHLTSDLEKYKQKLIQAINLDRTNYQILETNNEALQLLKKSKVELDQMMPPVENIGQEQSPVVQALKGALATVDQTQKSLQDQMASLTSQADQDNIIEHLMVIEETKTPKEPIFQQEISKFSPQREGLLNTANQLRQTIDAVASANSAFDRERGSYQSNPVRVQLLQNLETAVKIYNELSANLAQGHQFYTNLSQHLSVLQQKVSDFVYSRNLEKNDLFAKLSQSGFPQGGAQNQYRPSYGQQPNPYPSAHSNPYPSAQSGYPQYPPPPPPGAYYPPYPGK